MIQYTFERKEAKYIISKAQRDAMLLAMKGYMQPDEYGLTTICNIYFDTPSSQLIRESIEKPVYKEKVRLRTYGVPKPDSRAFVELKKNSAKYYDETSPYYQDKCSDARNNGGCLFQYCPECGEILRV